MTDYDYAEMSEELDMLRGEHEQLAVAARAMLAALDDLMDDHVIKPQIIAGGYYGQVCAAIAQAEAAGIKTEE